MSIFAKRLAFAAIAAGIAFPAFAADIEEPIAYEPAPPQVVETADYNGWYIRGDAGYRWSKLRGIDYTVYDGCGVACVPGEKSFDFAKLRDGFSLGGGVGYQATSYFRTDLTADYFFKTKLRGQTSDTSVIPNILSTDTSSYSALLLLANAYVDLGTYHGFTPYVGAGIGGAHVKWDNLRNTYPGVDVTHEGEKNWRFAYALAAGVSYCLTDQLALDGGYRYSRIQGGRMFKETSPEGVFLGAGPGRDKGFHIHEVRAGLRYSFGGNSNCHQPETVAYEPEPAVYKQ